MPVNSSFPSIRLTDSSIDHPQNALNRISSLMTANLLTLNSFKTEFLFTGLSKQLAKIHNSSFNSTYSARNLGLIFNVRTPHLFRPDLTLLQILLLPYLSDSLYPSVPLFQNSLHHCDFRCSLQA